MAITWDIRWPMSEGKGSVATNVAPSGSIYRANLTNCEWYYDSVRKTCIKMNGTSSRIAKQVDPLYGITALTIGGWFKLDSLKSQTLFQLHTTKTVAWVYASPNGSISFTTYDTSGSTITSDTLTTGASVVAAGTWYHVVASVHGTTKNIWVNGAISKAATHSITMGWRGDKPELVVGSFHYGDKFYLPLDGLVQSVRLTDDSTVADADVAAWYTAESGTVATAPVAPYVDNRNNRTLVYSLDTQAWGLWDVGFDCLASHSNEDNLWMTVGGRQGFVHQLFSGGDDGATIRGGTNTLTGTMTSGGTDSITDSSADFTTLGNGLAGCRVFARSSSTAEWQSRYVLSNTSTVLYLSSAFSPTVTGTYIVAPIDWYWESRWMDMGDPWVVKRFFQFAAWLTESETTSNSITFKHKTDSNETWTSTTFANTDEFVRFVTNNRGRKIKIRFENVYPYEPAEIRAFQLIFAAVGPL